MYACRGAVSRAVIFGCEGLRLSRAEASFFAESAPWGFILFARNVSTPDQVSALVSELREAVGWHAPVFMDQEGGRVQRLRPPHWASYPPALEQMRLARDPMRAQWLRNRLIAAELYELGTDGNCAPLADLVEDDTHPILLNRLYGGDIDAVVAASKAAADGMLAGGVLPVLKHIPGYGRASVDGHLSLPRVTASSEELQARDFAPFHALRDIKMGMTAHVLYEAYDADAPATTSAKMMQVIREDIGFGGLMMTDDISMEALSGTVVERSMASWAAGCDIVLHCNGEMRDMEGIAAVAPALEGIMAKRAEAALAERQEPEAADLEALRAEYSELLAG